MIQIKTVTKFFKRYNNQHQTLKSYLLSFLQRRREQPISSETLPVLKDISVSINSSEIFCITGPNGSGKSTLARLIARTTHPTSGEIIFEGRVVPFLQLGVAFNQELTGLDNLYLNGVLLGLSIKYLSKNKNEIFEFAGVEAFMHTPLKYYSSGMQLRLAFSIARHVEGEVYIFDEILAVGDVDFKKKCFQFFDELIVKKKTIIVVSHDLSFIKKHADRLLILSATGGYRLFNKKEEIQALNGVS
jgi:ABC-2 type transport system ATP-binding protein